MDRRNFIGTMLVAGAGFFFLPPSKTYQRLWLPDRTIVTDTFQSIWATHYASVHFNPDDAPMAVPTLGKVVRRRGQLWYGTSDDWRLLRKYRNGPITGNFSNQTLKIHAPTLPLIDANLYHEETDVWMNMQFEPDQIIPEI